MNSNWTRLTRSFGYAFEGISHAYRSEQNIRIHTAAGVLVCILAAILQISKLEWIIILFLIFGVICLELVNTSIERTVDLITKQEQHPLAKQAKDLAAGAVFLFACLSVIIGTIIFSKYIVKLVF